MTQDLDKSEPTVYERLRRTGAAIACVNGNNTHSGNLSMCDPDNGDQFFITSGGSQCGALVPTDIVPVSFSGVSWGDARGSSESTIHRRLLTRPGIESVVHAHYISTATISFDTAKQQLFLEYLGLDEKDREDFLYHPIDLYGVWGIGGVKVGTYHQPVGSLEMEERIPRYLAEDKITIVRGHGPFVCAGSPEEALAQLSLLESSATITLQLRRRGIDVVSLQKKINESGVHVRFPVMPELMSVHESLRKFAVAFLGDAIFSGDPEDPMLIADFRQRLVYNYENQISAYGAGSMSQRLTPDSFIYCPFSAVPAGFTFPLRRLDLAPRASDTLDLRIHKLIYRHTHQNACMITTSPLATAEGMAILADQYGQDLLGGGHGDGVVSYTDDHHPVVQPIDAEAIYLNPRLGLVDGSQLNDLSPANPILNMLRWYKGCCVVAGYGVISTGETTLEQAAHNASSAERIARFRTEVFINEKLIGGPPMTSFYDDSNDRASE
jgi:ribulose-5-phosphate 4-epimerase/fuculose-1-phosphate aldolase